MAAIATVGNLGTSIAAPQNHLAQPGQSNALDCPVEHWIRSDWVKRSNQPLNLARITCQTKQRMPDGGWAQRRRLAPMRFSKRNADVLACIGQSLGRTDEQTFAHLPSGRTLYYRRPILGAVTPEGLGNAGATHRDLTLREISFPNVRTEWRPLELRHDKPRTQP